MKIVFDLLVPVRIKQEKILGLLLWLLPGLTGLNLSILHVRNPTFTALWRFTLGPLAAQCY